MYLVLDCLPDNQFACRSRGFEKTAVSLSTEMLINLAWAYWKPEWHCLGDSRFTVCSWAKPTNCYAAWPVMTRLSDRVRIAVKPGCLSQLGLRSDWVRFGLHQLRKRLVGSIYN